MEEKTAGLAWHYRATDPEFGAAQAGDLLLHLATLLSNAPAEVLIGDHVVEIRPQGVNKGQVVQAVVARARMAAWWSLSETTAPTRTSSPPFRPDPSRCTWVRRRAGPSSGFATSPRRARSSGGCSRPERPGPVDHSAIVVPVPPIGAGRSFIFGSPSGSRIACSA